MSSRGGQSDKPTGEPTTQTRNKKENSIWENNVHLRNPKDGDVALNQRVKEHNRMISQDDRFIDYVHHCENQRR